jgi:hypothetical protein
MTEIAAASVPSESQKQSSSIERRNSKPYCWPLVLTIVVPLASAGLLLWQWLAPEYFNFLRISWILITSVIPGLNLMVIVGSLAQFRSRPATSSASLVLGAASILFCWWAFYQMTELGSLWLK